MSTWWGEGYRLTCSSTCSFTWGGGCLGGGGARRVPARVKSPTIEQNNHSHLMASQLAMDATGNEIDSRLFSKCRLFYLTVWFVSIAHLNSPPNRLAIWNIILFCLVATREWQFRLLNVRVFQQDVTIVGNDLLGRLTARVICRSKAFITTRVPWRRFLAFDNSNPWRAASPVPAHPPARAVFVLIQRVTILIASLSVRQLPPLWMRHPFTH